MNELPKTFPLNATLLDLATRCPNGHVLVVDELYQILTVDDQQESDSGDGSILLTLVVLPKGKVVNVSGDARRLSEQLGSTPVVNFGRQFNTEMAEGD